MRKVRRGELDRGKVQKREKIRLVPLHNKKKTNYSILVASNNQKITLHTCQMHLTHFTTTEINKYTFFFFFFLLCVEINKCISITEKRLCMIFEVTPFGVLINWNWLHVFSFIPQLLEQHRWQVSLPKTWVNSLKIQLVWKLQHFRNYGLKTLTLDKKI